MNFTMEVFRMGWLLPPYGLSAEVHDSTNSADDPYGGNSLPMRNTSIVKFICICIYIYIYIYMLYIIFTICENVVLQPGAASGWSES